MRPTSKNQCDRRFYIGVCNTPLQAIITIFLFMRWNENNSDEAVTMTPFLSLKKLKNGRN